MFQFTGIFYSFLKSLFFDNDEEAKFTSKHFKPKRWYSFFMAVAITVLGVKALFVSYQVSFRLMTLQEQIKEKDALIEQLKLANVDVCKK